MGFKVMAGYYTIGKQAYVSNKRMGEEKPGNPLVNLPIQSKAPILNKAPWSQNSSTVFPEATNQRGT